MGRFAQRTLAWTSTMESSKLQGLLPEVAPPRKQEAAWSWQPDYFFEGIDCFTMPNEFEPSEGYRRAHAAARPERNMGKRKKLSARNDVRDLIKEMYPASCEMQCNTAPVPPEILKLNDVYNELFPEVIQWIASFTSH